MARYGISIYGQSLYGGGSPDRVYDARPVRAYSFPKSYVDARLAAEGGSTVPPFYPSNYSPPAADPEKPRATESGTVPAEDYPSIRWNLPRAGMDYYKPTYGLSPYQGSRFYNTIYGNLPENSWTGSDFFYNLIEWQRPDGEWTDLTLVRRLYGPADTVDDGTQVLTVPSTTYQNEYVDQVPQGHIAYYSVFVRLPGGEWVLAGYTEALNCRNHDGLREMFNAIPRVYTSATGGMVDAIDKSRGHLSRFLQGLAFEYDYWQTQADRFGLDAGRLPSSSVQLWAKQFGMSDLDIITVGDRNLRKWLASASAYSETKGTQNGIEALSSALTGWPVTASVSPNLMLDTDDSSAENSTGRWVITGGEVERVAVGGAVTSPSPTLITDTTPLQDGVFEVSPSGTSCTLTLGITNPVEHGIPVNAGDTYKFNLCWITTTTPTGTLKADISWFDIDGTSTGTTTGSAQASSGSWQQTTTVSGQAPANTCYAGLTLTFATTSNTTIYRMDMMQFVPNSVDVAGKFQDARAIDLLVSPTRINLCTNPSFETNITGWSLLPSGSPTHGAADTGYVGSEVGLRCAQVTGTQLAGGVRFDSATGSFAAGDPGIISIYVKATNADAIPPTATLPMKLSWLNSGGTVLHTETVNHSVTFGAWTRIHISHSKAPANTSKVRLELGGAGTTSPLSTGSTTISIDGCLIEKDTRLLSYFDGAVYGASGASRWTGTAHASTSHLYPLRTSRQEVLSRIMRGWVPEPCPLRVVLQ